MSNLKMWKVCLMSKVDDQLVVALGEPWVNLDTIEEKVGSLVIAVSEHQDRDSAMALITGSDGNGGLVYDRLVEVSDDTQ